MEPTSWGIAGIIATIIATGIGVAVTVILQNRGAVSKIESLERNVKADFKADFKFLESDVKADFKATRSENREAHAAIGENILAAERRLGARIDGLAGRMDSAEERELQRALVVLNKK